MFFNISKNKKAITILLSTTFLFNIANAEDMNVNSSYLRLDAGVTQATSKLDNNDTYYNKKLDGAEFYGFGAGYIFNKNIRADLTLTGRTDYKFSYDGPYNGEAINANQNLNITTLMLNAYYNVPINDTFSPYINAGLGIAKIKTKDYTSSYNLNEFLYSINSNTSYNPAWNIGLGCQMKLNNNLSFDSFFRFIDFGKTKTQYKSMSNEVTQEEVQAFSIKSYEAGISLIYRF